MAQRECSKRSRAIPRVIIDSLEQLLDTGDEDVGEELELRCYIDIATLVELVQVQELWARLRVLEIAPPFEDNATSTSLHLSHPLLYMPSLEVLIVRNHAISIVRINSNMFPNLREFGISHPLGVAIDTFEINCPGSLERLSLEYLTVRDGQGMCTTLAINNRLKDVTRFATTVYLQGVV